MHSGQLEPTAELVAELVGDQFPQWAQLPVRQMSSDGTVNAIFRVGDDLVARLRLQAADPDAARDELRGEATAAGELAKVSPVPTPEPVALGEPGAGYPMPWAVYRWLDGIPASHVDLADSDHWAEDLAGFVLALRRHPNPGLTFSGDNRGGHLRDHDGQVRSWIADGAHLMDTRSLTELWESLIDTPRDQPDGWTHGDLMPGNLLVEDGRLVGVIDVGGFQVADPALDLQPAWNLFSATARSVFRHAIEPTENEWRRGMGWAFAQAIGCLAYYEKTNPVMSRTAHLALTRLLTASGQETA